MARIGRKDDEVWYRCPFCKDSENNKYKAHFSINDWGLYYCFRCGAKGKLNTRQFISFLANNKITEELITKEEISLAYIIEQVLQPGPGVSRKSYLDRYHIEDMDAFLSQDRNGETIGVATFGKGKRQIMGEKGFGYKGELISTPSYPLVLVEGPYDIQEDFEVCSFGLPSRKNLQELRGHYILLCPDGDVWIDPKKTKTILDVIQYQYSASTIVGVQILPPELDPDELPFDQRTTLTTKEVIRKYG